MNQVSQAERMAQRYGHTKAAANQRKAIGIAGGIGVAAVLGSWLWFAGLAQPDAQFQARDLGYSITDNRNITVQFEITVTPNTSMRCAIQALNAEYGIVGWQIVDIPASEQRTRVFEQPLRTSEKPVTGLLYRCWLP